MKKLAVIRADEEGMRCPFGLSPIPFVCKIAGDSVNEMTVLGKLEDEESKKELDNNIIILKNNPEKRRCIYAQHIFDHVKHNKYQSVDCNFGDSSAGEKVPTFEGSEFYPKNLSPISMDGLYSYPFSSQYDLGTSRNLYYGIYQQASREDRRKLRINILKSIKNG